jgi:hypothetical protein
MQTWQMVAEIIRIIDPKSIAKFITDTNPTYRITEEDETVSGEEPAKSVASTSTIDEIPSSSGHKWAASEPESTSAATSSGNHHPQKEGRHAAPKKKAKTPVAPQSDDLPCQCQPHSLLI